MNGKGTLIPVPAGSAGNQDIPDFGEAAVELYDAGFIPMPIIPGTKKPAVPFERWKKNLSRRNIRRYSKKYPDHELAVLLGPNTLVADADTPEGLIALYMLEKSLDLIPNLVVETARGEHHYFKLAPGTFAKSDAPKKTEHPDRFDIKTGNAIAIVPPSTGKRYGVNEAESADDLVEIDQAVVDAVFRHNGRDAPRQPPDEPLLRPDIPLDTSQLVTDLRYLLEHVDADSGYEDWVRVGMAIHHETGGSDTGFAVFDAWSSKGSKYPGHKELLAKWQSFDGYHGTPVTLGTLRKLAADNGADLGRMGEEFFTVVDDDEIPLHEHSLAPFSLLGMSKQFEAELLEQCFALPDIALQGHWTVIYGAPNGGKTLLVLYLIIMGIANGDITPVDLYYINADDNHYGLTTKLKLAEEYGFHMVAPGYRDFRVKNFHTLLYQLSASGRARGTVLIIDTLKKFTNLMDKKMSSDFGSLTREFIAKGGTMIALAHVNKKRGDDGKPIYAGTSDIVDDSDCAWVLDILSEENDIRTVQFENQKSRGGVGRQVAYRYSIAEDLGYLDILASVEPVDDTEADALRTAVAQVSKQDQELIQAVADCIRDGITSKTKLIAEVVKNSGSSRRPVEQAMTGLPVPTPPSITGPINAAHADSEPMNSCRTPWWATS
jgi:hypothetical protein